MKNRWRGGNGRSVSVAGYSLGGERIEPQGIGQRRGHFSSGEACTIPRCSDDRTGGNRAERSGVRNGEKGDAERKPEGVEERWQVASEGNEKEPGRQERLQQISRRTTRVKLLTSLLPFIVELQRKGRHRERFILFVQVPTTNTHPTRDTN